MRLSKSSMRSQFTWLAAIAASSILLAACGERVSKEKFEAVQGDLQAARAQVQSLETEKQKLQTKLEDIAFGRLANVMRINDAISFPPTLGV